MNRQTIVHKKPSKLSQETINEHIADVEYKTIVTSINPSQFLERELSWLQFNERVLELVEDESLPLLERLSFLSLIHI